MHEWHEKNSAIFVDAGLWVRPRYYKPTNSNHQLPVLRARIGNGHLTGQRFDRRTRCYTECGLQLRICYHQPYLTCLEPANTYTGINHA